jgi:hypothetical protein
VDGLFQQHRIATAEFPALLRLPLTRKTLAGNHVFLENQSIPPIQKRRN